MPISLTSHLVHQNTCRQSRSHHTDLDPTTLVAGSRSVVKQNPCMYDSIICWIVVMFHWVKHSNDWTAAHITQAIALQYWTFELTHWVTTLHVGTRLQKSIMIRMTMTQENKLLAFAYNKNTMVTNQQMASAPTGCFEAEDRHVNRHTEDHV